MDLLKKIITQIKSKFGSYRFFKKLSFGRDGIGFSLAEMMVVMGIVSIVLAAVVPIFTTKRPAQKDVQIVDAPIGVILPFNNTTIPFPDKSSGWLLCDGKTYLNTDYPDLYKNIVKDSTSPFYVDANNFKVPELQSKFVYGWNGKIDINSNFAKKCDTTTSTKCDPAGYLLAADQLPTHNHIGTTGTDSVSHSHPSVDSYQFTAYFDAYNVNLLENYFTSDPKTPANTDVEKNVHQHSIGSSPFNSTFPPQKPYPVMPPYMILAYMIKAK